MAGVASGARVSDPPGMGSTGTGLPGAGLPGAGAGGAGAGLASAGAGAGAPGAGAGEPGAGGRAPEPVSLERANRGPGPGTGTRCSGADASLLQGSLHFGRVRSRRNPNADSLPHSRAVRSVDRRRDGDRFGHGPPSRGGQAELDLEFAYLVVHSPLDVQVVFIVGRARNPGGHKQGRRVRRKRRPIAQHRFPRRRPSGNRRAAANRPATRRRSSVPKHSSRRRQSA